MEKQKISSLDIMNEKLSPHGSWGILSHYHYCSDPKLGPGIVPILRMTCSCHACSKVLSLYWDSKIKESFNHSRYGRVHNCKYSQIIGCHNNCIIMIF